MGWCNTSHHAMGFAPAFSPDRLAQGLLPFFVSLSEK